MGCHSQATIVHSPSPQLGYLCLDSSGPQASRINVNIFSSPAYKQLVVGRQQRRPLGLLTCPDNTQPEVQLCLPLKISREFCGWGSVIEYAALQLTTRLCQICYTSVQSDQGVLHELMRYTNLWSNTTQSRIIIARYVHVMPITLFIFSVRTGLRFQYFARIENEPADMACNSLSCIRC